MFNIVEKRYWYFLISALVIIPGLVAMIYTWSVKGTPLPLAIDFTGGSFWEIQFDRSVQPADVRDVFLEGGFADTTVQTIRNDRTVVVRFDNVDEEQKLALKQRLEERFGPTVELQFRSVGPSIGREVTQAAFVAVIATAIAIVFWIVVAFRKVPHAVRYGVCAVIAMVHDVFVATGLFAIAGLVLGWQVDALFLTALLTVIGFSVQDTIVVFDRIRENLPKRRGEPYETVVNRSLLETLHRSLVTQLNAIFVLIAILLFGGATLQQFIATLLVGMFSGTYSSIFNAVPLLVVWEKGEVGSFFRRLLGRRPATA